MTDANLTTHTGMENQINVNRVQNSVVNGSNAIMTENYTVKIKKK